MGGAFALRTLLDNLEASAEGASSPPRLLVVQWPVGTVPYAFLPQGSGREYVPSRILQPFEAAGLREQLIVLYGTRYANIVPGGGGGAEAGTVMMMTGTDVPGTRENGGEGDDACAGGPSFDQILLNHSARLRRSGVGYTNAIGDARVDSHETSSRCLSYGYGTRSIAAARPAGAQLTEHIPLLPTLSPQEHYMKLFGGFMPGGPAPGNLSELERAMRLRKSVLDFSLRELEAVQRLAPSSERPKIDEHTAAVRRLEEQLAHQLNGNGQFPVGCMRPIEPQATAVGQSGSSFSYSDPTAAVADDALHERVGRLHLGIIRAAFQCDLLRVATYQWASAASQVAFSGLHPDDPTGAYKHHPLSHRVTNAARLVTASPGDPTHAIAEFLAGVHTWYNEKMASVLSEFKSTRDVFGASLLDHTVVPFMTEQADATHRWSPLPSLILGGSALGMQGGQFIRFDGSPRPHNDVWLTIAQAFFPGAPDIAAVFKDESFTKNGRITGPIEGLWRPPG